MTYSVRGILHDLNRKTMQNVLKILMMLHTVFKKTLKVFFCLNKQSRAKAATNIVKDEYQSYLSYPKEGITPNVRVELPPMCFKVDFVRDWLYI